MRIGMVRSFNTITWREFISGLEAAEVSIEELPIPNPETQLQYFVRRDGTEIYWAALPKNLDYESKVGAGQIYNICKRLGLNECDWFPDCAHIL